MLPLPALPEPTAHEQQFRRQALMAVVAVSLATSAFGLMVAYPLNWGPSVATGLALLTVKNVLFLLWLQVFPRHYVLVGALHLAILAVTGVAKFAHAVLVEEMVRGLGSYSYWLPLTYVVAFLVFPARVATGVSVAIFAALATIFGLWLSGGRRWPTASRRTRRCWCRCCSRTSPSSAFSCCSGCCSAATWGPWPPPRARRAPATWTP
ncbi:hypothetical protein [Deinococcus multiflagellatus]|uniref:Uncharacterized protein n=1 Tax=Deinococcus multiflagellatus TaxID=1656887 RepID=A0ABW1ZM96_9DEIO